MYCVSLPGYTWECRLKYTGINLQTLQHKDLISTLENNIRGGIIIVMGDRYVKTDESKKILYIDANNWYGHSMSQPLPYDEIEMWHVDPNLYMNWLEEILNTSDDSDTGYFVEVDQSLPFCPENKIIREDKNNNIEYMKQIKPKKYTKSKKLICDWTDEKNYLVPLQNVEILC